MEYNGVIIYYTPEEVEHLRRLVRKTENIPGCVVEVGVFQGASASIIREETERELYLFDTFTGFPDRLHESDSPRYFVGDCCADESYIKKLMKGKKNVHIIKGTFPDTGDIIKDKKFSFVHIDVDIYSAAKDSLKFFLPRMNKGGIILLHDYPAHDGVKLAVEELDIENKEVLGGRQLAIYL